jgi:uncharacterized protein
MANPHKIFVNLPVKDLEKSKAFFTRLGFQFNPKFSDDKAACLVLGEDIFSMLLTESYFKTFTRKEIADAARTTEAILALSCESKAKVDELADKALAAGGKAFNETKDLGFMYNRSFQDPDGHLWELVWMDPAAIG